MAVYRYQIVSVGMWRGKIKRWNTTLHEGVSTDTAGIYALFQASGYPNPGDVLGDCSGGVASISVYASTGGAPILTTVYFDWQTPGTWIPYTGTAWSGVPEGTLIDSSGESALIVVGHMAAHSVTGKPVTTRKYLHAIPSRSATDYGTPDVDAASQASLKALWGTSRLANPLGVQPATTEVLTWYGNHQRVRGRRRTTSQVAAQSFSAGVVAGAGASTGGAGGRELVR